MAEINFDELGPVDYLVISFPADKADFSGAMATELRTLLDKRTIRVLDLVVLSKDADGSVDAVELQDSDHSEIGELRHLEADLAILLAESDILQLADDLEPASAAAVLVYENTWAAPFSSAIRKSGGEVVTSGRIPIQSLIAGAEADREAANKEG
jgi:hypothetical protein